MDDFDRLVADVEIEIECAVFDCNNEAIGDVAGTDEDTGRTVRFPLCESHYEELSIGDDDEYVLFDKPDDL